MRISDWSSGVCSSDLARWHPGRHRLILSDRRPPSPPSLHRSWRRRNKIARFALDNAAFSTNAKARGEDRTGVVQGKSGSVRVDLDGRRSSKKYNITG